MSLIRSITLPGGETAYAILAEPDWSSGIQLQLIIPVRADATLADRETRARAAAAPRWRITLQSLLTDADGFDLAALRNITDDLVVIPLWPWLNWADHGLQPPAAPITLAWDDDQINVNPTNPQTWPNYAPAIVCRLDRAPRITTDGPALTLDLEAREDGPTQYAWLPDAPGDPPGPTLPDGAQTYTWPYHWLPQAGVIAAQTDLIDLGGHRTRASSTYPHSPHRTFECVAIVRDLTSAIRWLHHRALSLVWIPDLTARANLLAAASAGATTIGLQPSNWTDSQPWIAIMTPDGYSVHRVTARAGSTCTIAPGLPSDISPSDCFVAPASLSRVDGDPSIRAWQTHAQLELRFRELPPEYASQPPGWERGISIGATAPIARLYEVTLRGQTWRWTDWERDLTWSSQTWPTRPTEPSTIFASSDLASDDITLKLRRQGNTGTDWLDIFRPGSLVTARLTIYECNPADSEAQNVSAIWQGWIEDIAWDGPIATLRASPVHAALGRPIPRALFQRNCNWRLFDGMCGLSRAAWTFTAQVISASGASVTVGSFSRPGGLPSGFGFAHWFAWGTLSRASGEELVILDSTALASGSMTISLIMQPETPFTAGETVTLIPGCDGLPSTCKAWHATGNPAGKFSNYANFGGFPHIPAANPSLRVTTQTVTSGGKK